MPLPPRHWAESDIDEHWADGHRLFAEALQELKQQQNPYAQLINLAARAHDHFGCLERYDLDLLISSLRMALIEFRTVIALTDGIWLPGIARMPDEIAKKRVPTRTLAQQRKMQAQWYALCTDILTYQPHIFPVADALPLSPERTGWLSKRYRIMARDGFRCRLCGKAASDGPEVRLEVDHKQSRYDQGADDEDNLWTLCFECNRGKNKRSL